MLFSYSSDDVLPAKRPGPESRRGRFYLPQWLDNRERFSLLISDSSGGADELSTFELVDRLDNSGRRRSQRSRAGNVYGVLQPMDELMEHVGVRKNGCPLGEALRPVLVSDDSQRLAELDEGVGARLRQRFAGPGPAFSRKNT